MVTDTGSCPCPFRDFLPAVVPYLSCITGPSLFIASFPLVYKHDSYLRITSHDPLISPH